MNKMREKIERELKEEREKKEIILDAVTLASKTETLKDIFDAKRLCLKDNIINDIKFSQDALSELELIENEALKREVVDVAEYEFVNSLLEVVTLDNGEYYCNFTDGYNGWSYIRDIDGMIGLIDRRIKTGYNILKDMDKPLIKLVKLKDKYEAIACKLIEVKTEKERVK